MSKGKFMRQALQKSRIEVTDEPVRERIRKPLLTDKIPKEQKLTPEQIEHWRRVLECHPILCAIARRVSDDEIQQFRDAMQARILRGDLE